MKFAKELEQDLVPEWRAKYLDYKTGKKRVKAVARAATRMNATPRSHPRPNRSSSLYGATSPIRKPTKLSSSLRAYETEAVGPRAYLRQSPAPLAPNHSRGNSDGPGQGPLGTGKSPSIPILQQRTPAGTSDNAAYGSFVPTPPNVRTTTFELPDPAVDAGSPIHNRSEGDNVSFPAHNEPQPATHGPSILARSASVSGNGNAYEVGQTSSPHHKPAFASFRNRISTRDGRPLVRRMFSVGATPTPDQSRRIDMSMMAVDQVRLKQREFFDWMDKEVDKVETFYRLKEDEAGARLSVIREQLHEMRNRRIQEVAETQNTKNSRKYDEHGAILGAHGHRINGASQPDDERPTSRDRLNAWFDPFERIMEDAKAKAKARITRPGSNSKALQKMKFSPEIKSQRQNSNQDNDRDYTRKLHEHEVPYRTAKRKLKLAMQEFYRGIELLKSYALLNRTAFRKINKKYDKAVDAYPPLRYMSEKVNKAWFVQSDVLDSHLHAVEDLYARYFERGNRKVATGKLRSASHRSADQSASSFRNGILIGIGAVFAIQGVIYGADLLYDPDPTVVVQTSYLLQIYGGYFLALYLFSWFCVDCSIWSRNKVNYHFIFEFDTRHNLDWRQLSEFPSFLILVLGLFIWVNFSRYGTPAMYLYYPVILIFVTVVFVFLPAPIAFHRSRKWFAYSLWRLLLAGLYPVEFRDFFLGDMFCSLTYLTGNIELFFCLYAHYWNDPTQCNSTHSRLLGFFTALPGIWRAFQCLRRYRDTRNSFPHLVNCGKYLMTIMYYMTLSLYRIKMTNANFALFVTFATINACYCSVWDIFMDWSLLQPNAKHKFLRDVRAYKNPYYYYGAMIIDPIIRFNWIFYAIYIGDIQHSTLVSFFVALSEITRRGIWVIFRVENEHCANVARFKASRDIPLPYDLRSDSQENFEHTEEEVLTQVTSTAIATDTLTTSPALSRNQVRNDGTLEAQVTPSGSIRRRPTLGKSFTRMVADAHTQDFEKKRKPALGGDDSSKTKNSDGYDGGVDKGSSDDDSEAEDLPDEQDLLEAQSLLNEGRNYPRAGQNSEGTDI